MALKILVLGGTGEGRLLAEQLARDPRYDSLLSFAGRTSSLVRPTLPHRVGGFGGAEGLADFLRAGAYQALVDVTHPFAARISSNAVAAARAADVPLIRLSRPAWERRPGDDWIEVSSMAEAARALGDPARRVFLSIGKQELAAFAPAPHHHYLVRAIDQIPLTLPHAKLLSARGPFALHDELQLLQSERIELLVSKNAGTAATYPKIQAARMLRIPVIMVQRPLVPAAHEVQTLDELTQFLEALHTRSKRLGE